MCCCNKEKRTKIHVKNVMMVVLRGLKTERRSGSLRRIRDLYDSELCRFHGQREYDWFERSWQNFLRSPT